jgi:hypothetical protein
VPGRTLLVIGSYSESLRTLLPVVRRLAGLRKLMPLVCIDASGQDWSAAAEVVQGAGLEVFEGVLKDDLGDRRLWNPYRRERLYREANRALAGRVLARTRPEGILCTRDTSHGQLVRLAGELGIPSVYVQWTEIHTPEFHQRLRHAELRYEDARQPAWRRAARRAKRAVDELVPPADWWPLFIPATRLAVQGRFTRDMCLRAGIPEDRIRVTGTPQCDDMHRCAGLGPASLAAIRADLGTPPDVPFLLYTHEHTDRLSHLDQSCAARAETEVLTAMRQAAPHLPRLVKLHPRAGAETRARLHAADPEARIVGSETSVGELIAASAAMVSMTSSTLLWAVGIDRPGISAYFWEGVDEQRLTRHWTGVELADTRDQLVEAIRANIDSPEHAAHWAARRAAGREEFLRVDGRAVERIVETYCEVVDGRADEHSPDLTVGQTVGTPSD